MRTCSYLLGIVTAAALAIAPRLALAQVTVPPVILPRQVELGEVRLDQFYFLLDVPVAYPAEVDLEKAPLPTVLRALWLGPDLHAQLGLERLGAPGGRPDGFGVLAGLAYPLRRITTAFWGFDLHGAFTWSRADRPDRSYRTQLDGTIGVARVGVLPAPVAIRVSGGPVLRLRSAPAPGGDAVPFLGGGLAAGLFGTFTQRRLGVQLTAEWLRIGDPYRGPGHHGDWRLAFGAHYQYDLIAESD